MVVYQLVGEESNLQNEKDTIPIISDEEKIEELVNRMKTAKNYDFIINTAKTKVLVLRWVVSSTTLSKYEKISSFIYLCSTTEASGGLSTEIQPKVTSKLSNIM